MHYEIINICDIPEKLYLAEQKRDSERTSNYRGDNLKRTLAGRILLAGIIKKVYNRDDFTLTYNENGKPETDFCFLSISHSGDLVACAVSDSPVGIDIELIKSQKAREQYLLFSSDESRYVNTADDRIAAYFTLWTRKEAYIKAIGGILSDAKNPLLLTPDLVLLKQSGGFFYETVYSDAYILSVCEKNI